MLCIEFNICTQFVIRYGISAAGLHAAKGVSDWLCVNPTFGYERDAVDFKVILHILKFSVSYKIVYRE